MTNELIKVSKYWSGNEISRDSGNFYMSPITRPFIIESAYGKDFVTEYKDNRYFAEDIFIAKYLSNKKIESVLSLCCGFGSVERRFVSQLPDIKLCIGIDIANDALEQAQKRALEEGITCISYRFADLNNYSWEQQEYDLVIANGALHHLNNLEGVLEGIHRVLKPGGILYACEYVGPSYQDQSARQLQIINAAAFLVPPELRGKKGLPYFNNKRLFLFMSRLLSITSSSENPQWPYWKKIVVRLLKRLFQQNHNDLDFGVVHVSPKEYLLRTDPSEGVRSSEIIPLVKQYFPNTEVRPFGGGIMQHALDKDFYNHFNNKNLLHLKSLEMLYYLERHFMDTGEIDIENAYIIARR